MSQPPEPPDPLKHFDQDHWGVRMGALLITYTPTLITRATWLMVSLVTFKVL